MHVNQQSSTLQNPVQDLWKIILLYGFFSELKVATYAVMFVSMLGDNNFITSLVENLPKDKVDVLKKLNRIGVMDQKMYKQVFDYIRQLKIAEFYERVPSLDAYLSQDAKEKEVIEMYKLIVDAIVDEPDQFPTISSGKYEDGISDGVILDTENNINKYGLRDGAGAVAVTTEFLKDILGLEETRGVRFREITRVWHQNGLLLKRENGRRLQDFIHPWPDRDDRQRFYIFRIDDLKSLLDQAFDEEESDHE